MEGAAAAVVGAAQLVVALLCRLLPDLQAVASWGVLQGPLFRLAWLYGRRPRPSPPPTALVLRHFWPSLLSERRAATCGLAQDGSCLRMRHLQT